MIILDCCAESFKIFIFRLKIAAQNPDPGLSESWYPLLFIIAIKSIKVDKTIIEETDYINRIPLLNI